MLHTLCATNDQLPTGTTVLYAKHGKIHPDLNCYVNSTEHYCKVDCGEGIPKYSF